MEARGVGGVDLEQGLQAMRQLWAVGARPAAAARDLVLAAAREALVEDADEVPVAQARHVLQLLSQRRLALNTSCLSLFMRAFAAVLMLSCEGGGGEGGGGSALGGGGARREGEGDWRGMGRGVRAEIETLVSVLDLGAEVLGIDVDVAEWWEARMEVMGAAGVCACVRACVSACVRARVRARSYACTCEYLRACM